MKKIFQVTLYFVSSKGERSTKLIIEAADIKQAVLDSVRFYEDRQETESYFEIDDRYWGDYLGCVKAHGWAPDRIDAQGRIVSAEEYREVAGSGYFEWKCDYPGKLEDWFKD